MGDADSDREGKVLADGQERIKGSSRGPFGDEIKIYGYYRLNVP